MGDINAIKGLAPWRVMEKADHGDPWCWRNTGPGMSKGVWRKETSDIGVDATAEIAYHISIGHDVSIIDTTTPEIDWDKFDYPFFNQYGGLPINSDRLATDPVDFEWITASLRESPLYYWPGGEQPVPDNVEVMVEFLLMGLGCRSAEVRAAKDVDWKGFSLVSFKLTGVVF